MYLIIEQKDHEDKTHRYTTTENAKTMKELQTEIQIIFHIDENWQEIMDQRGRRIDKLVGILKDIGIDKGETLVVKHADLPVWCEYKDLVESVKNSAESQETNAIRALELYQCLVTSHFLVVYTDFISYFLENHHYLSPWTNREVNVIRKATEDYFRNLHDQRRGNEESDFTCYFEEQDGDLNGTKTLAFIRLHGEAVVSKYKVKCHYYGAHGASIGRLPDITELYCYKLLELIGVGPKCYIIPPSTPTEPKTNTYIATQWEDRFDLLTNVIDENRLSLDVVVQLEVLRVLLFISDFREEHCGQWKGTKSAAVVNFSPTDDLHVYTDIKEKLLSTYPHKDWKNIYLAIKNQHDDTTWLKTAKVYMEKWDLKKNSVLAREQLDPSNTLLKHLEIGVEKPESSPTELLDEFIDTLNTNVENLQLLLNSIE